MNLLTQRLLSLVSCGYGAALRLPQREIEAVTVPMGTVSLSGISLQFLMIGEEPFSGRTLCVNYVFDQVE